MIQVLDHHLKVHLVFHTMAEEVHLTDRQIAQRKWYAANRDRQIAYQLSYHNANREARLVYQREYNKTYYQANRQRNRKAEKIEAMIPTDADVSSLSSKLLKAEQQAQRAQQRAEKKEKEEAEKVTKTPSQWEIPEGAVPWKFLEQSSPKPQKHTRQKKKSTFQFVKGNFELSFD